MKFEIHSDFKALDDRYTNNQRDKVIEMLFDRENWKYCSASKTWRKVVNTDDAEFPPDELPDEEYPKYDMRVAFIKEPDVGCKEFVDYWFRIYTMAKGYLKSKSVYYHEPVENMPTKAMIALLIACEVYYDNLENKVLRDEEFIGYLGL